MKHLKIIFSISFLMVLIFFFSRCLPGSPSNNDPRGDQYAGSQACAACHQSISGSYAHGNHYKSSAAVSMNGLEKLIGPSRDRFYFTDSSFIGIENKENALFQSYFTGNQETASERFDIAFGSAEKAQTYGYWKEDKLYQLPLTFFTSLNVWANSPGFPARHARFERVIGSRCFECHASYINKEFVRTGSLTVSEKLDRRSIVYGIDCERCHGPAARHVKFQQDNPSVKTAQYIVSIGSLSRQRQLDLCAMCHSGNDQTPQRSLFSFVPGDTLSHFYFPAFELTGGEPDVHGKQLQLLESSECFRKTEMTCTSCHNSHGPEQNNMTAFISKCMNCHQHSVHATGMLKENEQIKRDFNLVSRNCIDCHMPLQTSKTIYFNNGDQQKNIPYLIRTHKIAVYQ